MESDSRGDKKTIYRLIEIGAKMNFLMLKNKIKNSQGINKIAEVVLDIVFIGERHITGSFTKNKEDVTAKEILNNMYKIKTQDITYVDIGANNWRRGNNTCIFYLEGANGILIEADPFLCGKLRKKRMRDKIYNVAVGTENRKTLDFYILSMPTRNSLDKTQVRKSIALGLNLVDIIQIPCITVNEIIKKNHMIPDLLSIDIEGMDYKVLQTIDYKKYPIKVIIAESSDEKNRKGQTMDVFMKSMGYCIFQQTSSNTVYFLNSDTKIMDKF